MKEKYTTSINVRLTHTEVKQLKKLAKSQLLSLSAYVRRSTLLKTN